MCTAYYTRQDDADALSLSLSRRAAWHNDWNDWWTKQVMGTTKMRTSTKTASDNDSGLTQFRQNHTAQNAFLRFVLSLVGTELTKFSS